MSVPLDTRLRAMSGAAASGSSNLPHVSAARSSAGRLARRLRAAPPSTEAPARRSLDALSATGGGNNPLASPAAGGANDSWFATEVGIRDWAEALELGASSAETVALLEEMGARYDPARLAAALASRPTALASRSVQVAAQLGGFVAAALGDAAAGRFATNAPARAAQLRRVLGGLGPAFVKVGQALSARPDLLPPEYLAALAQLQDRLPTFPSSVARALIEEELGRPLAEVFSQLDAEPVAAASLGQVYRGVLRSTGERVAVKVQRPGIGEGIAIDMVLLRRLVVAVDATSALSQQLAPLVDEFAAKLFAELDYEQEGRNAERFAALYAHVPRVRAPGIRWEATARRVLTMEWIEGVKLTDAPAMAAAGLDVVDFVRVGVEATLRQLLEAGFFHADPHPGNLLAARNGDLVYLDFGMMSEAPPAARYALIAHVVHLVNRDYPAMCRDYYALDFMDAGVDTAPIAPALAEFFDPILADASVTRLNFRTLVDGLGGVLFRYPFRVPPYYALILRSLTVLEGLALSADADFQLLGAAYPYLARRLLTDPAPALRASFQEMVLGEGGRLRWSRLEGLVAAGGRAADFEPEQLWALADWATGEGGRAVRAAVAAELVRLVDAVAAGATRAQVAARSGSLALAARLVPAGPEEAAARRRAKLLWGALAGARGAAIPTLAAGGGPLGLPGPGEAARYVGELRAALSAQAPRLQALLATPGAQEVLADLQWGLVQRVAARAVKLALAAGAEGARLAGGGTGAAAAAEATAAEAAMFE